MTILQAIILGIVQGLSEFLPISSSAHIVFTQNICAVRNGSTIDLGSAQHRYSIYRFSGIPIKRCF